jgi:hypothetical protein
MTTALLVTRNYEPYRRIIQPVKKGQYHSPRIAEHRIDTLLNQCSNDNFSAWKY